MSLVALQGNTVGITAEDHPAKSLCTQTTTAEEGCFNVLVGGVPVHYVTGTTLPHEFQLDEDGKCDPLTHIGVLPPNTSTVFVYPDVLKLQIARLGDKYNLCGTLVPGGLLGSNVTVFAY